jgi:hypothetical protein
MLAYDAQSGAYVHLARDARAWSDHEDLVLCSRPPTECWRETVRRLPGRSEIESKRRLKALRRNVAPVAAAPVAAAPVAEPFLFDYTPQLRLAQRWSDLALADAAQLVTCEASYLNLRCAAELVARVWPQGPGGSTLYARWVKPLEERLRAHPDGQPLLRALLRQNGASTPAL